MSRPRVVLLRGHGVTPWELRPWQELLDRYEVTALVTRRNRFPLGGIELPLRPIRTVRGLLPPRRLGDVAVSVAGDRYLGLDRALRGADIVHSLELGVPWSAQPAALKRRLGFKLVLTVWETIPLLDAYRRRRGRRYRRATIPEVDAFLATTERARAALMLEGAPAERIEVVSPGVDYCRFSDPGVVQRAEVVVSAGRLVWEKGHQDVLRAVSALRRGIVEGDPPRLLIVGAGPEARRLRKHAEELGIADIVSFEAVSYERMPSIMARASRLVLASLPTPLWEEQFGTVLAEAMAAGVPIVAAKSGAIPEVVGDEATLFAPGDWLGLARILAGSPPGQRRRLPIYTTEAMGERLAEVYDRVLAS